MYSRLYSLENLYNAYTRSILRRRNRPYALNFFDECEKNILSLYYDLKNNKYIHGQYESFIINDSKKRLIKAAPFRDRVVHHALCNIIEPIFEKSFIYDSYACRKGKGTHAAIKRIRGFIRSEYENASRENKFYNRNSFELYYLKCDISKYFDSVNHDILLSLLEKKMSDRMILNLCERIIRSVSSGIPIGNLTSQLFANIYLNELDQYVKRILKEHHYIRYMDDFVILSRDENKLCCYKKQIQSFLYEKLKLKLHQDKSKVFPLNPSGIDFLGYRIFQHHIELRSSTVRRRKKKFRKLVKLYRCGLIKEDILRSFIKDWNGYTKHAKSWKTLESIKNEIKSIDLTDS